MRTLTTKRPRVFMRKTKNKTATTATVSRLQLLSSNILPLHLLQWSAASTATTYPAPRQDVVLTDLQSPVECNNTSSRSPPPPACSMRLQS